MFTLLTIIKKMASGKFYTGLLLGAVCGIALASSLHFGPRFDKLQAVFLKHQADLAMANAKLAIVQNIVVRQIETQYRDRIKIVKEQSDVSTNTASDYVTEEDAARSSINLGFVRSYNAAFTGAPARPPTQSDREPSRISLTDLASTNAFNAGVCRQWREQVLGLRDLYLQLQQAQALAKGQ